MFFSQKQRYARALPQELHILLQLLGNSDEQNLYKRVSGRRIIVYKDIF